MNNDWSFAMIVLLLLFFGIAVSSDDVVVSFKEIPPFCTLWSVLATESFQLDKLEAVRTRLGSLYSLRCSDGSEPKREKARFMIVPGQHFYFLKEYYETSEHAPSDSQVFRVVSSYGAIYCPGRFHFEPVWRDAIRSAAFAHQSRLCFCGAGNTSTRHSLERPDVRYFSKNAPNVLLFSPTNECNCELSSVTTQLLPPNSQSNLQRTLQEMAPYHFVLPCHHGSPPGTLRGSAPKNDIFALTNCAAFDQLPEPRRHETRVFWINDVCHGWSRLVVKSRMWYALRAFYGLSKARLIMPRSYDLNRDCNDDLFCERLELVRKIESEKEVMLSGHANYHRRRLFIAKDPYQHKQKGIALSTGDEVLESLTAGKPGFSFITDYVPKPFLVENFKINMRRYVLLVCTGKRARAFVHDNGKNFYGKRFFAEPWGSDGDVKWKQQDASIGSTSSVKEDFVGSLVTTGYNLTDLHSSLPVTSDDFIAHVLAGSESRFSSFRRSMSIRLGLAIHMAATKFSLPRERSRYVCEPQETPSCLLNAVRFIHLGCDFHVDEELTGGGSRMFECNLSPDFHVRDDKDGAIKEQVATDFISFLGFEGPVNDSTANLKHFNLGKFYDSESFDEEESFRFLENLDNNADLDDMDVDHSQFYAEL